MASTDRPRLWPSISTLIFGSACFVLGLVLFFVVGLAGILNATVYQAPTHVTADCHVGDYYVYQSTTHFTTLSPDQVKVFGPSGNRIPTWGGNGSETITQRGQSYSSAVGFHVPVSGRYSVSVNSSSATAVIIAPSLNGQIAQGAPWLILAGFGFFIAVAGLVWLIVSSSRRKRTGRAAQPPWIPMA